MRFIPRRLDAQLIRAARAFPVVVLSGPRRSGKTTLLRRRFPAADYRLLEDPAVLAAVRADPRAFLDGLRLPAVLDEIQNAPELLRFIRARVDARPRRAGQWLLTGSQDFSLMQGVTESMAGRAAILQLLPLSSDETDKVTVLRGGFPEVLARPRAASLWFQSYIQTYIERDVRQISRIRDLATFRRFIALVASRCGQLLNRTDLAAPLGMSIPAISEWIDILETTGQILLVPPYFENLGKRLIKTPKLYFTDSGLACHLLGIESVAELARSTFHGAIFEGFVASEIVKQQVNRGHRRELYHFRDQRGLEVDFIVPRGADDVVLVEAKASRTVYPSAAKSLLVVGQAIGRPRVRRVVVHGGREQPPSGAALAPGVDACTVAAMLEAIARSPVRAESRSRRRM